MKAGCHEGGTPLSAARIVDTSLDFNSRNESGSRELCSSENLSGSGDRDGKLSDVVGKNHCKIEGIR